MQNTSTIKVPPTPETTLSAIALRSDAHATVLDRYKLDFCCRGARSLGEACKGAGLEVERVLAELNTEASAREEARSAGVDWQDRTPDELIDFIVSTHHDYTRAAFARLTPLVAKVAGKHAARHPELGGIAATLEELEADLLPHMMKEERVLFPYILDLSAPGGAPPPPFFGTVRNPVRMMMLEHDRAAELLAALARTTANFSPPENACVSFRALYAGLAELRLDLLKHVSLENNVLFPKAIALEDARAPAVPSAPAPVLEAATCGVPACRKIDR
jgi:regulator of cell morphogenesis and NO signaling